MLNEIDVKLRREGVLRGGYIAKKETGKLDLILLSCGSELQHALAAAKELGEGTRVVSMPCFERFERQPESIAQKSCLTNAAGAWRSKRAFRRSGRNMSGSTGRSSACTASA